LHFKFSTESNGAESSKWAGLVAGSNLPNASSPYLSFITAGTEAGRFDSSNNLSIGGDLLLTNKSIRSQGGSRAHWFLSSDETQTIGLQTNSLYMRSPTFAWYSGGTHDDAQFSPGTGGNLMMKLHSGSGADSRLTVQKLTITNTTPFDSTAPMLSIGEIDSPTGHIQFSNASINNFNANFDGGTLNLQQSGGILNLGGANTDVKFPSRIFWTGGNRVVFGDGTFPGTPATNDWWFDYTNERILVRASGAWHQVARYTP
jgi:hypothetical protein